MLLFSPQNKLIFRDTKVQFIPEGKAASDCWCCGPQDNCYLCQDPTSPNNGKKFYGGTTTTSGFPSTYDQYDSIGGYFQTICGIDYYRYWFSWRTTNLTSLNLTWTNTPNAINDCTNLPFLDYTTKHNILYYVTPMGYLDNNPCGLSRRLMAVWEVTALWSLGYGYMVHNRYGLHGVWVSSQLTYSAPGCPNFPSDAPLTLPFQQTYSTYNNICAVDSRTITLSNICSSYTVTVTSTPNYLP